ncbi:hypothetical protein L3Y34_013988 [Caenorhabditis briggsae]|uniref:Uncharacterized protein n=3 Tax=Caenorhabditis briggsae TaxID=6238 RepID=A0AAE9DQJ8_CAEBR|nr:hypothetical protein L3Y34_013988 [Caenorhabditis briggsae]
MWLRGIFGGVFFIFLLCSCTALFVLHSLYFIFRTTSQTEKTETKTIHDDQLFIPALIICNRMPFSQDGLNNVNVNLRQDSALRYLLEWTNPSLREAADYTPPAADFMNQGQNTVLQYITQSTRNQTIQNMQYQCQSVINSCSYQGIQLSSFDCCRNLLSLIPSVNGLCWVWRDSTMWQNSTGINRQFSITFQMTRNSWFSTFVPTHPGVDVYLREDGSDVMRMATELENPIRLQDKRGVRLQMRKTKKADIRRTSCGYALGDARRSDVHAFKNNHTNYLMCNMMVAMRYCNCHPLMAELLHYDPSSFRDFLLRVSQTNVCSVDAYDNCARRYIDLTRVENWDEDIPKDLPGYEDAKRCRNDNQRSCLITSYPGTIEGYDLPEEYRTTQDYVSRLVLEYSTMRTTEILVSKDPNIYELLSFIGYNMALWFTVGHILWSMFWYATGLCCPKRTTNRIMPIVSRKRSVSSPEPIIVEHRPSQSEEAGNAGET